MQNVFHKKIELSEWDYFASCFKNYLSGSPDSKVLIKDESSYGAIAVPSLDILGFNRALKIGIDAPLKSTGIDEIMDFFRDNKIPRFFVQVSPEAEPGNIKDVLLSKGFKHYNNWAQLYYELPSDKLPKIESALSVKPIGLNEKSDFSRIIAESFGWEGLAGEIISAGIGRDDWLYFLIYDGDTPISAAAMHFYEDIASLAIGATLEEHRGKGAQKVLINYRTNKAIEAGCKFLATETAEDTPEKPSPSYRNMIRSGFKLAYVRPNYIFEF